MTGAWQFTGLCQLCPEEVTDILDHMRVIHPEVWADLERWPDGEVVVHRVNFETPEDLR